MYKEPYLQPYKGKATRHTCPECGTKNSFTLYLDGNTHEPINSKVGKCNREIKCGYHYTPKQYYNDNQLYKSNPTTYNNFQKDQSFHSPSLLEDLSRIIGRAGVRLGEVPFSYVEKSASYKSNFVRFLCEFMNENQIIEIGENYAIGATQNKEVIFWQIDINGKVRTGKIMQYNPETGKRVKHENGAIDWVHNKLKYQKLLPEDFNLKQCFFGEHLLKIYPDKTVAIVESEKSAVIASVFLQNTVWLAAGNLNGLSAEKCQVLKNRNIILYPDLGAYAKWQQKAIEIQKECQCKIQISQTLENIASGYARENGYDIADFIIDQLFNAKNKQQEINLTLLEKMKKSNPHLAILCNILDLQEICECRN